MKPNQNTTRNFRGNPADKPSLWEKIDTNKINQGKLFTEGTFKEGTFGNKLNLGLKGQLRKIQFDGRKTITKNLSNGNIKTFYDMISGKLKNHKTGTNVRISRLEEKAIMGEAEKLVRKDEKFTRSDKADLKTIIDTIQSKSKKESFNKERYTQIQSQNDEKPQEQEIHAPISNNIEINTIMTNKLDFIETKNDIENTQIPEKQRPITHKENENKKEIEIPDTKDIKDMPI